MPGRRHFALGAAGHPRDRRPRPPGARAGLSSERPKVYSLHAPDIECIGKGKARAPSEFGCKVSVIPPATKAKGGQIILDAQDMQGNLFDDHTPGPVVADLETLMGARVQRIHVHKSYRGHIYLNRLRVWISGQVRNTIPTIHHEMKRRTAVEPVIGHLKAEHRMGRNCLEGRDLKRGVAILRDTTKGETRSVPIIWSRAICSRFISTR
jgi:IS5 family transposase